MRLTTAALGNLKLEGGATDKIIFDDEVPGFGIRIRASGAQTWIFQYKIAGKTRRLVLGQVSAIKLAKARETAGDLHAQVRLGGEAPAHLRLCVMTQQTRAAWRCWRRCGGRGALYTGSIITSISARRWITMRRRP